MGPVSRAFCSWHRKLIICPQYDGSNSRRLLLLAATDAECDASCQLRTKQETGSPWSNASRHRKLDRCLVRSIDRFDKYVDAHARPSSGPVTTQINALKATIVLLLLSAPSIPILPPSPASLTFLLAGLIPSHGRQSQALRGSSCPSRLEA